MGQSRLRSVLSDSRRHRSLRLRRRAWKPGRRKTRRVRFSSVASTLQKHEQHFEAQNTMFVSDEFSPRARPMIVRMLLRGIGLTSDIILLIVASPFFVVWFFYRTVRNFIRARTSGR